MTIASTSLQQEVYTLYHSHHGWLVNLLRRRLGCVYDANDLAQDTFMRVIDKSISFVQINEPRALLSTIAHGLMVDHIRRKELEGAYLKVISQLPQQHVASPEESLIFIEAIMHIDNLFKELKPKVRIVFYLSKLEGLTYLEIADQLGISQRTVESHMADALRCLIAKKQSHLQPLR